MTVSSMMDERARRRGKVGGLIFLSECLKDESRRLEIFGAKEPLRVNLLNGRIEAGDVAVSVEKGSLFNYRINLAESTERAFGHAYEAPEAAMQAAIEGAALASAYHPVEDWLRGLEWDKTDRLTGGLPAAFGQQAGTLQAQFLRYSLRAMVARALTPGCQVDTVTVLVGGQGKRKSRGLRALAGEWFGDPFIDVETKDSWEQVHRFWLLELAELSALRSKDLEAVKAFATRSTDSFRAPYARQSAEHPRRSVFWGTTNQLQFLMDATGQRRWWPVVVGETRIDLEWIRLNRAQAFAQARAEVEGGAQWWLTDDEEEAHRDAVVIHTEQDPWENIVADWLADNAAKGVDGAHIDEILGASIELEKRDLHPGNQRRMATILRQCGAFQNGHHKDRRWRW